MDYIQQTKNVMLTPSYYYDTDVSLLERERLCTELRDAWQCINYTRVVSLVADLAYLVGRFPNAEEGEHILLLGIQASRHLHDQPHLAQFLNRLACFLCTRDRFEQALQVWQESRQVAQELGYPVYLWEPLCQVAHIADLLGAYGLVQDFCEQLLTAKKVDTPMSVLLALFIRGFYMRVQGEKENAYTDFNTCLCLLTQQKQEWEQGHTLHSSFPKHVPLQAPLFDFFGLEVQAELARTQGEYAHAKGYGEAAIALARTFCDPYTVTALLFDQAHFAYQQGMFADAYLSVQHLLAASEPATPSFHIRGGEHMLGLLSNRSQEFRVSLSTREQQILQLVARGCSNQEIANALVITVGTVKKHIEHIYLKLDARSRTHAVAKARALNVLV